MAAFPQRHAGLPGAPAVAIEPTLENVAVLGLIVVIRTVLSFSLEIEIEGMPPWRRAAMSGATHVTSAARMARPEPPAGP